MSHDNIGVMSVPMVVIILAEDREDWSDVSNIRSYGSHELHGLYVISNGSTSGGDISSVVDLSDNEYNLDDLFIVDMNNTDGEGSFRGDDKSDELFMLGDYVNIDDEGSEDCHGYIANGN